MIEKVDDISILMSFICEFFPDFKVDNNPFEKVFCYKLDNKVVGFISYSLIYDRAELNYIAVDKNFRKRGIGAELLQHAISDLKNNMVENFSLEVFVNNDEAISFYLSNGFKIKTIRHNYYNFGDAYLMVMEVI